jgi:glycine C-acetyltransferase
MSAKQFEDFLGGAGREDIFSKAVRLYDYLASSPDASERSLGLESLTGPGPRVEIKNRDQQKQKVIMLGSNSYLDLGRHPQVLAASSRALEKYGYGMGAVSVYAGISDLHSRLEEDIAAFTKSEAAIVFPGGYGANVGIIAALCGPGDVLINDSANHASIFDGCLLSGAEVKIYPHNNVKRLEQVLAKLPESQKGRLIITDGVFSMHGDLAPLDEIAALAEKYQARLMVDDAHGLGIVGPTGRGTAEAFGLEHLVDLKVSMLSKAPCGLGAYCAGPKEVIRYLKLYARPYFFSTAMPAPVAAGLIEVFKLMARDEAGRTQLWRNINYMHDQIIKLGFQTNQGLSGIIPIMVGDEDKLARFHQALLVAGVYTNIVTYPAVRRRECRLRLCVMATLSKEDMDFALFRLESEAKKCGLL